MENADIDQIPDIVWGESEFVTETLDDNVIVYEALPKGSITLRVGNTGFEYFLEKTNDGRFISRFDFMPEGRIGETSDRAAKHAMVLCRALMGLRVWFKDEENINKFGIDLNKLPPMKAVTNFVLINGFYNLFENHGEHGDFVQSYCSEDCDMALDLKAFIKLPESDDLVLYLKKIEERTQTLQISHWKALAV